MLVWKLTVHLLCCVDAVAPNADKLYKLFQNILKIRNIEHQILYKECQVSTCTRYLVVHVCTVLYHTSSAKLYCTSFFGT